MYLFSLQEKKTHFLLAISFVPIKARNDEMHFDRC